MKKIFVTAALLFTTGIAFCQTFMHGAGISVLVNVPSNGDITYGEGFTYFPRFNFIETESLSVSAGIPLSIGVSSSVSTSYSYYGGYYDNGASIGFVVNAPLIINLNMGRGSTKDNEKKFGYFVGAGFGYHHGDFLVDDYNNGLISKSTNAFGPAANGGLRFGVGRKHKNIELRFSYMKGLNDDKPSVFGVAGGFNF